MAERVESRWTVAGVPLPLACACAASKAFARLISSLGAAQLTQLQLLRLASWTRLPRGSPALADLYQGQALRGLRELNLLGSCATDARSLAHVSALSNLDSLVSGARGGVGVVGCAQPGARVGAEQPGQPGEQARWGWVCGEQP